MSKFEKKAPVVEAIRWDGTEAGAVDVSKWFQEQFPNISIEMELSTFLADGEVATSYILFRSRFQGLNTDRMRDGNWVVAHQDGSFEIMYEESFNRDYQQLS